MDSPPLPIISLTPQLAAQLKLSAQDTLLYLLKAGSVTKYFSEAPKLAELRQSLGLPDKLALNDIAHLSDPNSAYETFTKTVPFSSYEDYRPFISPLLVDGPCHESSISNLLAPGIPEFIATSSGTSKSGTSKYIPKYRHPESVWKAWRTSMENRMPKPRNGGSSFTTYSLGYGSLLELIGDDSPEGEAKTVKKVPFCIVSGGALRMYEGWNVEDDEKRITSKAPGETSPHAICFIKRYRAFLLMHALFALVDTSLELINTQFATMFFDFTRLLDEHWEILVQAVEDGKIPEFDGMEEIKHHLQAQFRPYPERAAELRVIGKDTTNPGWMKKIWPNLDTITANSVFQNSPIVRHIRHYVGPEVRMRTGAYLSSESRIALAYDPYNDFTLYKVQCDDIIEYLDITESETTHNLKQAWEIEVGKHYELVLTTLDGFWRYRLGDIIELAGFSPEDGQPIIRYYSRKTVEIRIAEEWTSEKDIQVAIQSIHDVLQVVEFTVVLDYRTFPGGYGYLVELKDNTGIEANAAPEMLHQHFLATNGSYATAFGDGYIGKPTVRVVAPGTFGEFRDWKVQTTGAVVSVKVPTVVFDIASKEWLITRVVEELKED